MKPASEMKASDDFASLSDASLRFYLDQVEVGRRVTTIELFDELASTNDYLLHKTDVSPDTRFHVCFAECQTAGRGRLGRRIWHSPKNGSLYLSVLRRAAEPARFARLTLTVAVEVVRALAEYGVENLEVKPPNDVVCRGHKLGGVLVETKGDRVVVGLGLNVYSPGSNAAWTSLSEVGWSECSREQIAAGMIAAIVRAFDHTAIQRKASTLSSDDS